VTYPYIEEDSGSQQPMRLEIDGEEVHVSEYVTGDMPDLEFDEWEVEHGVASLWLDSDRGFGVAVIKQTHQLENKDGEGGRVEFSIVSILVATGTDAVSELPDHN
jgi:hypothetical protein